MPAPIPSIQTFKEKLTAKGLNRGLFYVTTITGSSIDFGQDELIICKSVTLPPTQIDSAEIKYFTRTVKIPGTRQYSPLTLSFYNTPDYKTRSKFLTWVNAFNDATNNFRNSNARPANQYFAELTVKSYSEYAWKDPQYPDRTQQVITVDPITGIASTTNITITDPENVNNRQLLATYKFTSAYPTSVTAVQYSYENDTQPQTYDVEFQYLRFSFETNT